MKKIFFCALFFLIFTFLRGQSVQWSSGVIDFSSELSPDEFSARQVLKRPNVLPACGINPAAWIPLKYNRKEFLKVSFEQPMKIRQIVIAETHNPGSVEQVFAYDKFDREYLIFEFTPHQVDVPTRLLKVFVDLTKYEVAAVKVVFDGKAVGGYYSIDGIGISDSEIPVEVNINVAKEYENWVSERLSEKVNSPYDEFNPLISPDGKTLYFSRSKHPENLGGKKDKEDIWYSELDETTGQWKKAQNLGAPLNNKYPNFVNSISPDGDNVLLLLGNEYNPDGGKMKAGVSMSDKRQNKWSAPKAMEIINDYNISPKANYYLASSRKTLLMSIEREDTYGDRDIYISFLNKDSTWTEPFNIGSTINTIVEESAPFLAADDKTLYFSSKGFSGYGGSDIYMTRRTDDTWKNWTEPKNLGNAINSEDDDYYLNIPASGQVAYYSRQYAKGNMDIYSLQLPVEHQPDPVVLVKGKVFNAKTKEPIEANILYEALTSGKELGISKSNSGTGSYEILLPSGAQYGFLAEADGYISVSENMDLKDLKEYKEIEKNLFLVPVEKGSSIVLNNIFFSHNKANIHPESFSELNRLVEFLNKNLEVEIQISGHTDNTGSAEYNRKLSYSRAESVYTFIIKKGIDEKRIKVKSYGEEKPVASNIAEEGRALNRRVEFTILKEGKAQMLGAAE